MPSGPRLDQLYDEHADALYAHLSNLLREDAAVRDVLQEVFLRLARDAGPMQRAANPRAYLLRLAHNLAIDTFRRRETRERRESEFASAVALVDASNADDAAFAQAAEQALGALPEEQRLVVQLKIWEELTFAEIADVLGISANTAASRYRYALEKLRAAVPADAGGREAEV